MSVCIGSEDSFKSSRHNQFEEMLFKCEDDRFELDLVIECNMHTIKILDGIVVDLNKSRIVVDGEDGPSLTEELDVTCRRTIERIYGERAQEVSPSIYNVSSHAIRCRCSSSSTRDPW